MQSLLPQAFLLSSFRRAGQKIIDYSNYYSVVTVAVKLGPEWTILQITAT